MKAYDCPYCAGTGQQLQVVNNHFVRNKCKHCDGYGLKVTLIKRPEPVDTSQDRQKATLESTLSAIHREMGE